MMDALERSRQAKNVTLIGAAVNFCLGVVKIIFGWVGRSHALIADGIHSLSDLVTDALVLIASHYGSRKADWDHPYGHQRIETAATLFLALLLALAGFGIIMDSADRLWAHTLSIPKFYVLIIAFLSVVANELLYHITKRIGRRIQSKLLLANAWHHRSDAASSIVVLVGVAGALLGYPYFDSIAAIIVGLMIIKMGWGLGWSSVRELIDTGVSAKTLNEIRAVILSIPGVTALHQLRTRCMADAILVDAHILVDSKISVSEGHFLATKVHQRLKEDVANIRDVTIHVDPEDDEIVPLNRNLPLRPQVMAELMAHWLGYPGVDSIHQVTLHYLGGKISVEITMPLYVLEQGLDAKSLLQKYNRAVEQLDYIKSINIHFF